MDFDWIFIFFIGSDNEMIVLRGFYKILFPGSDNEVIVKDLAGFPHPPPPQVLTMRWLP